MMTKEIKSICIFCGSSAGSREEYSIKARDLGHLFIEKNISLVYGGSNVGLMRVIADTMLEAGGKVIGVMPHNLINREVAHKGLTEFHVVETMAERKEVMDKLSDAFISMPGGVGTLDELFEVMSWNQLELITKPVALYNVLGYYDQLLAFLDHSVDQRFVKAEHRINLISESDENVLLEKIFNYEPVKVDGGKWIKELHENKF
ncbi:MAG: TIGR00730 family Rossman fold protein [Bacteroidales bacterium]|nr:TIGR00730 family Rossman fold protein [Bacteroidales bacterium]